MTSSFPRNAYVVICAILFLVAAPAFAKQIADPAFKPQVEKPAYAPGEGPTVSIDEAHHNFLTMDGGYKPFADLLRSDGYQVTSSKSRFTPESLKEIEILVIANALSEKNLNRYSLPVFPAFTPEEIDALRVWVEAGGSLMLVADHMPWAGAAKTLGEAFGFLFADGFAITDDGKATMHFETGNGTLQDHPILRGRTSSESIDRVMSFTGQAFRVRRGVDAKPVMVFNDRSVLLLPSEPWKFSAKTPRMSASGMFQAATLKVGAGRIAVFGDATMFTAKISDKGTRFGMNHPEAKNNARFLLNAMHWLSGKL